MVIGYKKAVIPELNLPVIVTLKIPINAKTNILRVSNNMDQAYAKYRCSYCHVLEISDPISGRKFYRAVSMYESEKVEYKVGQLTVAGRYDDNPESLCSSGIHFFLSYYRAKMYRAPFSDSHFQMWFDNGSTRYYAETIGRMFHGMFLEYDSKGQLIKQYRVDKNLIVQATTCSWKTQGQTNKPIFEDVVFKKNTLIWDVIPVLRKMNR
jgi:hypothetical protein